MLFRSSNEEQWLERPLLATPYSGRFRQQLLAALRDPRYDRIDLLVSFVMLSGLDLIIQRLDEALDRGAQVRILTTDYLLVTDAAALNQLHHRIDAPTRAGTLKVKVFSGNSTSFHPKAYLFSSSNTRFGVAFVGSSNLSKSALTTGIEWNVQHNHLGELLDEFDHLWADSRSLPLTGAFIDAYAEKQHALGEKRLQMAGEPIHSEDVAAAPTPTSVQDEALRALEATRISGYQRGLVVMATGLGKTWLAAFDTSRFIYRKVLFVAHREEILNQARDTFGRQRPTGKFSVFMGAQHDVSGDVVFASVQALQGHLAEIDPDLFDYVVIDEFHHASAPSYRKVLSHFRPKFMLGLTATPDRSDAADLLALCEIGRAHV